jgi:hypothetical protein
VFLAVPLIVLTEMLQYYSVFPPKMFEMTTEKVFHADDKYVLRLLNVIIHEHQFKRKGKYYKFHFDKEAYTKPKNVRIFMF